MTPTPVPEASNNLNLYLSSPQPPLRTQETVKDLNSIAMHIMLKSRREAKTLKMVALPPLWPYYLPTEQAMTRTRECPVCQSPLYQSW